MKEDRFIGKLKNLRKAFRELTNVWEELDEEYNDYATNINGINEEFVKERNMYEKSYPFECSLDDLTHSVGEWVESMTLIIKKEEAKEDLKELLVEGETLVIEKEYKEVEE